jgi:DHA1 family tetracycline resistance protein-like MFS transporter
MQQTTEPKITIRMILSERAVRTVILVALVMLMGVGLIAPTLALYARSFGVGYSAAGLLLAAFGLGRLAFDLIAGPLVDRFGERTCATAGLLFLAVCAALTAIAPVYWLAVALWGLGGAGSAVTFAAQYSYLLKAVPADRMARTLGVFYTSFNAGIIGGGAAGGFMAARLGLASPLLGFSILMVVSALIYARAVPDLPPRVIEPAPDTEGIALATAGGAGTALGGAVEVLAERALPLFRRTTSGFRELLKRRALRTVLVLNFAYMWVIVSVYETLVPLFGHDELGMSEAFIGTVFAVAVATEFFVLYPAGSAADRYGRKPVLVPSFAALAIMVVVLGWASTPALFLVMMGLLGIAAGFAGVPPAAMLSDVVPDERAGSAVGLFRFAGDLGWFLGPLLASAAADLVGFKEAFAIAAVPVAAALLLLLRTPETLRPAPSHEEERHGQDHIRGD